MAITKNELKETIEKIKEKQYKMYFFLPDHNPPSGGIKVVYDQVNILNQNGYNAIIVHSKKGFTPTWLSGIYEKNEDGTFKNIPILYTEGENISISMEDFIFVPEGYPNILESIKKQRASCKTIVFCQNWYYIMNALPPGVTWEDYGVKDVLVNCKSVGEYAKLLMPSLNVKYITTAIDQNLFNCENKRDKSFVVAFQPSRDGGAKSYNAIKTFYAIFPHLKFVQFKELKGLTLEQYAQEMKNSTFYVHFDEFCGWGTAPLEAFNCKNYVTGWDGIGTTDYFSQDNGWVVRNGDILAIASTIGRMIEEFIMNSAKEKDRGMEQATMIYTKDQELDSTLKVHNEYREERIEELENILSIITKEEQTQ